MNSQHHSGSQTIFHSKLLGSVPPHPNALVSTARFSSFVVLILLPSLACSQRRISSWGITSCRGTSFHPWPWLRFCRRARLPHPYNVLLELWFCCFCSFSACPTELVSLRDPCLLLAHQVRQALNYRIRQSQQIIYVDCRRIATTLTYVSLLQGRRLGSSQWSPIFSCFSLRP